MEASYQGVACCADQTLLLDIQGSVWGAGDNRKGALSLVTVEENMDYFAKLPDMPSVESLYTGYNRSYFIDDKGAVWACGDNSGGRLGIGINPQKQFFFAPRKVPLDSKVRKISANSNNITLFLDDSGCVWKTGEARLTAGQSSFPSKIEGVPPIIDIAVGSSFYILLDENNKVWAHGRNVGQFGIQGNEYVNSTRMPDILPPIAAVFAGYDFTLFLDMDGNVLSIGNRGYFSDNLPSANVPRLIGNHPRFTQLSANHYHFLGITEDREVYSAGQNSNGELGRAINRAPNKVERLPPISSVFAGNGTSLFVDLEGSVFACGSNSRKKLGCGWRPQAWEVFKIEKIPPAIQYNLHQSTKSARKV